MKPIRIMVVGLGKWGQKWIASIREDPEYQVVALVDQIGDHAEQVCSQSGLDTSCAFQEIEDAVKQIEPEAALIAVPPVAHYSVAMECMADGLHILSEKPLANNIDEALSLLVEAQRRERQFMVSQDYRWQPAVQTLRSLIAEGRIGDIGYITFTHFQSHRIGGWREQMQHVVLEDMSIHHFDLLRYITGKECVRVSSESFNPSWSWYRGGAVAAVHLTFEDDVRVHYLGTWVTSGWIDESTTGEIRIEGARGSLLLNAKSEVHLYADGVSQLISHQTMDRTGRAYALQEFCKAVSQGEPPETDIGDNIKSFSISYAALKSCLESRPIGLDEIGK